MSFVYQVFGDPRTATPPDVEKVIDIIKRYGNMKAYPVGENDTIEVPKPLNNDTMAALKGVWQGVQLV